MNIIKESNENGSYIYKLEINQLNVNLLDVINYLELKETKIKDNNKLSKRSFNGFFYSREEKLYRVYINQEKFYKGVLTVILIE